MVKEFEYAESSPYDIFFLPNPGAERLFPECEYIPELEEYLSNVENNAAEITRNNRSPVYASAFHDGTQNSARPFLRESGKDLQKFQIAIKNSGIIRPQRWGNIYVYMQEDFVSIAALLFVAEKEGIVGEILLGDNDKRDFFHALLRNKTTEYLQQSRQYNRIAQHLIKQAKLPQKRTKYSFDIADFPRSISQFGKMQQESLPNARTFKIKSNPSTNL